MISKATTLLLLTFSAIATCCGNANSIQKPITSIGVEDFEYISALPDVRLIDVRTPKEYADGHISGAENIDVKAADFAERIKDIKGIVAVYCRSGKRSLNAAKQLANLGCKVYDLTGGILAWQKAGKPTTKVETDVFTTKSGKLVKIHALMHSSIRIEYEGYESRKYEIVIDPCANLNGRKVDYSTMPKAFLILVTHEHFDHYDPTTIGRLSNESTYLFMNPRCVELYGNGSALKNGDKTQLADDVLNTGFESIPIDIHIEAVPAYNTTEGRQQFHPKGRDNGYILTLDSLRIYIAGDTEDIPEMADLKDIDIAFLPCNQPYTMTPEQLVNAAKIIKPKVLFPYHYGETDISGIPAQLPGIDVRIRHYE